MDRVKRLKEDLVQTGRLGRRPERKVETYEELDPQHGVTRPTGSEENRKLRDYAVDRMHEIGLEVSVDRIGNIFGRKEGFKSNSTVMFGSHLDSVVNGGMFDGALGVFGAIEAIRRIREDGFVNHRALEVVIFTGEEGSAFKQTLLGSSVLTGKTKLEQALEMKNDEGQTLEEVLQDIGYKGHYQRNLDDVEYMLELHIEQGPVLYEERIPVGVIENITGIEWMLVTILGQENHAGTTPMKMRKDALVAAAEIISFVHNQANTMMEELGSSTVGTVGKVKVFPNGINAVPGKVELGIDIRDVRLDLMEEFRNEILKVIDIVRNRYRVRAEVDMPPIHRPAPLSTELISIIEKSANQLGIRSKRMNSGAGHDSQNMAEKVKTGMIFIPSVNGISHSPLEWSDWEDIEKGVKVLTQTVKNVSSI